jgi:Uma2 family endonuclease
MKTAEALMPVPGGQVWPLSVEAYHALGEAGLIPEPTELLYGFVYHKMPKSPLHSYLVQFLVEFIRSILPPGLLLRAEQPIACADSEPEPDLSIVRGQAADFRLSHPRTAELVMEICVTSHEYDRSKLRAYAEAGVKECWLVLAPEKQIEVYRQPSRDQYAERSVHGPGGVLTSRAVAGLNVDLKALFG